MKTIYYLEDDWRYAKAVISRLTLHARDKGQAWDIRRIPTESDFLKMVEAMQKGELPPPSAFILDIMVQYAKPTRGDDFEEETLPPYDRAGIRCMELVRQKFANCPVVLFSVLDEMDLPPEMLRDRISFVPKEPNVEPLFTQLYKDLQ